MSIENQINDYSKNKDIIDHWLTLKGEYRYKIIINFLKENSIECTWNNITHYIKYDKRLLINLFKYIVFLEELFKSFISQYKQINPNKILSYSFKKSLIEFLLLKENNKYDDMDLALLDNEKNSIIELRNSIVHNKILLNRKFNNKNLKEMINIFIKILPKSYRNGFIKDINNCSKNLNENLWYIKLE